MIATVFDVASKEALGLIVVVPADWVNVDVCSDALPSSVTDPELVNASATVSDCPNSSDPEFDASDANASIAAPVSDR